MLCPRCIDKTVLVENTGALGEAACPGCQARFLDATDTTYVLEELAGIDRGTLVEDAAGAPQMAPCPACLRAMSQLVLDDCDVWLCTGCGSSSLASGALATLSRGRFAEPTVAHRGGDAVGVVCREPVKGDVLAAAFAEARFRTAVDAHAAGDRGHGIIAERATRVEADAVVTALARRGVVAEMVDQAALALPRALGYRLATVDDEGISIEAQLPLPVRVRWADVVLVAAGVVRVPRVTEERKSERFGPTLIGRPSRTRVQAVHSTVDDVLFELVTPTMRVKTSAHTLDLPRGEGVSVETAFRGFARGVLSKIPPDVVFAGEAKALRDNALARLTLHRAKSWEHLLAWERWRGP